MSPFVSASTTQRLIVGCPADEVVLVSGLCLAMFKRPTWPGRPATVGLARTNLGLVESSLCSQEPRPRLPFLQVGICRRPPMCPSATRHAQPLLKLRMFALRHHGRPATSSMRPCKRSPSRCVKIGNAATRALRVRTACRAMRKSSKEERVHMRWPRSLALALALAVVAISVPSAQAKTEMVRDSVSAQLTGNHGATELTEKGAARGTFSCSLTISIKLSYTRAYIGFYCGALVGSGNTAFYVSGRTSYFHGTLVITRGSGRYRHSAGSRLNIAGTLHRGSYSLSGQVTGPLSV